MNTCRLTINHHPDTDQCGGLTITHAVHVEPINIDAPDWVTAAATRHMCTDHKHRTKHNLPDFLAVRLAMDLVGLNTVVVLAREPHHIDEAIYLRDFSKLAHLIKQLPSVYDRPKDHTAAVVDLTAGKSRAATREQAWEAK